jgi:hypothetical protein
MPSPHPILRRLPSCFASRRRGGPFVLRRVEGLRARLGGRKPPELDLVGGTWFNVPGGALSLASSLGKVVYHEFGFPTCPGCRFMAPHMQRWHEQWGEKGLVVISVENGPQTPLSSTEERVRAGTSPTRCSTTRTGATPCSSGSRASRRPPRPQRQGRLGGGPLQRDGPRGEAEGDLGL